MSLRPRPEVENLETCPHGGLNYAELKADGLDAGAILDFSVCSNPFMPPPGISRVISRAAIDRYPDSEVTELRQRLSVSLGVAADNIIAGSGTTELIRLIALAYFRPGDPILILEPTFGEYEVTCRILGARLVKHRAREADGFAPRIDEVAALVRQLHPRAVFLCNPNNPTGKYLSRAEVEPILDTIGDGLLVLDEAYVAFVEPAWPSIDLIARGNVVVLRSMTKDYGLAGLRLGYAVASREIIASLRRVCPPWNVNTIAQTVGTMLLERADYLEQTLRQVRQATQFLVDGFSRLGLPPLASDANYFLLKVGDARSVRAALLRQGILVRDCTSFGLPEYIRVAPRTLPQCRKLIDAVDSLIGKSAKFRTAHPPCPLPSQGKGECK